MTPPDDLAPLAPTFNRYMVGAQGDAIVSLKLGRKFTRAEALNLAAWIVVILGPSGEQEFTQLLSEILHT